MAASEELRLGQLSCDSGNPRFLKIWVTKKEAILVDDDTTHLGQCNSRKSPNNVTDNKFNSKESSKCYEIKISYSDDVDRKRR